MNPKSLGKYTCCSRGRASNIMLPVSYIVSSSALSRGVKGSSVLPGACGAGLAEPFQAHDTGKNENHGLFERANTSFVQNYNNDPINQCPEITRFLPSTHLTF